MHSGWDTIILVFWRNMYVAKISTCSEASRQQRRAINKDGSLALLSAGMVSNTRKGLVSVPSVAEITEAEYVIKPFALIGIKLLSTNPQRCGRIAYSGNAHDTCSVAIFVETFDKFGRVRPPTTRKESTAILIWAE